MRVMRTLYVTEHHARIRVRKANLVVERVNAPVRVPIETLEAVVLLGRAEITNDAVGELARRGVRVSALSKGGRLRFSVTGGTSGNVLLRLAQVDALRSQDRVLGLARMVVAGKLQNSRRMVARWQRDAVSSSERHVLQGHVEGLGDSLNALGTAGDGDSLRGVEGAAARRYFKAMAQHLGATDGRLAFERRTRRPPRDPLNALLSFVYGLMVSELVGALDSVGLDPQVGYLHAPRPGRPSLALDLLEEFRPSIADRFSVARWGRRQVRPEHFAGRVDGAVYLSDEGRREVLGLYDQYRQQHVEHPLLARRVPIALLPHIQATLMARHLRGDLEVYPPYTMAA